MESVKCQLIILNVVIPHRFIQITSFLNSLTFAGLVWSNSHFLFGRNSHFKHSCTQSLPACLTTKVPVGSLATQPRAGRKLWVSGAADRLNNSHRHRALHTRDICEGVKWFSMGWFSITSCNLFISLHLHIAIDWDRVAIEWVKRECQ